MNTLIISTFSCTFEEFKNDVTTLFLEEMCKEFVTDYEFVKVNEHKSHLLMNCTDLEKLGAEMESPFAKEWDCLLYTSPSPRDRQKSRMPSSA